MLYQLSYVRAPLNDSVTVEPRGAWEHSLPSPFWLRDAAGTSSPRRRRAPMNAEFAKIDHTLSTASPRSLGANQAHHELMTRK
jgi:hypothetical protein